MTMRLEKGFSLIELMIVVAIIAVLASLAVNSYRKYVLRSHRSEAQRSLMDMAGRQERYYYTNNAYATSLDEINMTTPSIPGGYYTLSVDAPAASASTDYVMSATAIGQQAEDTACAKFTINRAGSRTSNGATTDVNACWGQ